MTNRRTFIAELAVAAVATGSVFAAPTSEVDVYLDPT